MKLTPDDLHRPAIHRIAHTITVLTTPVWLVPVTIAMLCSAVAFVFVVIAECTRWLMNKVIRPIEELKWLAAEAYVKRWPTVAPSGLVIPPLGAGGAATGYTGRSPVQVNDAGLQAVLDADTARLTTAVADAPPGYNVKAPDDINRHIRRCTVCHEPILNSDHTAPTPSARVNGVWELSAHARCVDVEVKQ